MTVKNTVSLRAGDRAVRPSNAGNSGEVVQELWSWAWPGPGRAAPQDLCWSAVRLLLDKGLPGPSDGTTKEGPGLANTSAEEREELQYLNSNNWPAGLLNSWDTPQLEQKFLVTTNRV